MQVATHCVLLLMHSYIGLKTVYYGKTTCTGSSKTTCTGSSGSAPPGRILEDRRVLYTVRHFASGPDIQDIYSTLKILHYNLKKRFEMCFLIIKLGQCLLYVMQLMLKVLSQLLTLSQLHILLCLQCIKLVLRLRLDLQHQQHILLCLHCTHIERTTGDVAGHELVMWKGPRGMVQVTN